MNDEKLQEIIELKDKISELSRTLSRIKSYGMLPLNVEFSEGDILNLSNVDVETQTRVGNIILSSASETLTELEKQYKEF